MLARDVVSSLPPDAEASEAVQPTVNTEAGSVRDTASGNDWLDALRPDGPAILVGSWS